jgi:hypothetical protein
MNQNAIRLAKVLSRRQMIKAAVTAAVLLLFSHCCAFSAGGHRRVGLSYNTIQPNWSEAWGTPALGRYSSDDKSVIEQHAAWLSDAGVDFIFIDWSNDLPYSPDCGCRPDIRQVEEATYTVFDTYKDLARHPKIAIMIGFPKQPSAPADGTLQRKADQVYQDFIANKERAPLYQRYEGKPLLIVYTGTPTPYQKGLPPWNDSRFTVRYLTGFVSDQPYLLGPDRVSKFGYWSWEDRGPQTYTIENEHPETMTVTASWRGDSRLSLPARSRMEGATFIDEWTRAREKAVKLVLVVSWNEWTKAEQIDAESGKDLEPSLEFGDFYLKLLKDQITEFKGYQRARTDGIPRQRQRANRSPDQKRHHHGDRSASLCQSLC